VVRGAEVSVVVRIPGPLQRFSGGRPEVVLAERPRTAGEALRALFSIHPGLRDRVVDEQGKIRTHVNVFVGADNLRDRDGLRTPLQADDELSILASVSGGCEC
jgi:molybdopterin synthase sulfur carrier subunit